jgi:hypothetical protein
LLIFVLFWSEKKFMGKNQWESSLQVPLILFFEKKCNCENLIGAYWWTLRVGGAGESGP